MRCNDRCELRRLRRADLPALVRLRQGALATPVGLAALQRNLKLPWAHMWGVLARPLPAVAAPAGLVAHLDFWVVADELHLHDLLVAPAWRRVGLGRELLQVLLRFGLRRQLRQLILEVGSGNLAAQRLYASCGFVCVGRRRAYYAASGEDALLLQRQLVGPRPYIGR